MSSIFDNYDNLQQQYIPSNMNNKPCPPKANPFLDPAIPKQPYCEYNAEGNLVGYWWAYGNTVNLEFDLSGEVTVENDNYIDVREFIKDKQIKINVYNFRHEIIDTMLFDGKDYQSFVKVDNITNQSIGLFYIYDEDTDTYSGVQLPEGYEAGTQYYISNPEDVEIVYPIDADKSASMFEKGTYYCSLSIIGKGLNETVFFEENCTLMVR